jgi:hypothetical protein
MAIQMRRGADNKFDPAKMLPAEIAVTVDGTRKVYAAFGPGDVKELASKEEVQNIVNNFTGTVDKKIAEAVKQVTDEAQEQIDNIENKAQEVLDSIPADYQNAVKQVEKNTLAIFDLDRFKASAIIQKAKGRSIVIKDSAKAGIPGMRTLGKSEQRKLTGKNLLEVVYLLNVTFDDANGVIKSITTTNTGQTIKAFMYKGNERIEIFSEVTKLGSHEWSFVKQEGYNELIVGFNGDKADATASCDISHLKNGASYKLVFTLDSLSQNASSMSGVMIVEASVTDYTYEPYCGGSPVPNPKYPQAIVNAGQKMVDGWQLLDTQFEDITIHGVSLYRNADGSIKIKGTSTAQHFLTLGTVKLIANKTYFLSGAQPNANIKIDKAGLYDVGNGITYKPTEDVEDKIVLRITSGITYDTTVYPMLNEGTTAKPWEPYTGGVEAVVDIPIETEVLSGNLAFENIKGYVGGDSIFDIDGKSESFVFKCKKGHTYVWSADVTNDRNAFAVFDAVPKQGAKAISGSFRNDVLKRVPFEVDHDGYGVIYVNTTLNEEIKKSFIVNEGTTVLPYQPYTRQPLTINKPGGFPGIEVTDASLANYTDENGQMWCCDERDWDREIYVGNLLPNNAISQTKNGGTFTVNADGSVTVNGTFSENTSIILCDDISTVQKGENYILSGCPSGGTGSTYLLSFAQYKSDGTHIVDLQDVGNGKNISLSDNCATSKMFIWIAGGQTFNNAIFKPMIRPVEIDGIPTSAKYVPYTDGKFVKMRGADVQRILTTKIKSDLVWYHNSGFELNDTYAFYSTNDDLGAHPSVHYSYAPGMCSHGEVVAALKTTDKECFRVGDSNIYIRVKKDRLRSVDSAGLNEYLAAIEPITLKYILATPIYTHITEEEASAQMALHTNYPATTILSNADHEVEYVTDTKTYIDNKFAELAAAYVAGSEV